LDKAERLAANARCSKDKADAAKERMHHKEVLATNSKKSQLVNQIEECTDKYKAIKSEKLECLDKFERISCEKKNLRPISENPTTNLQGSMSSS
jgi:hypothetical protein